MFHTLPPICTIFRPSLDSSQHEERILEGIAHWFSQPPLPRFECLFGVTSWEAGLPLDNGILSCNSIRRQLHLCVARKLPHRNSGGPARVSGHDTAASLGHVGFLSTMPRHPGTFT